MWMRQEGHDPSETNLETDDWPETDGGRNCRWA